MHASLLNGLFMSAYIMPIRKDNNIGLWSRDNFITFIFIDIKQCFVVIITLYKYKQ